MTRGVSFQGYEEFQLGNGTLKEGVVAPQNWKNGDYVNQPGLRAVHDIHTLSLSTPARFNRSTTRQSLASEVAKRTATVFDACDRVLQLQAMMARFI